MNVFKGLVLALVLGVVGAVFSACGSDELPSDVAIQFYKEAAVGDSDDAFDMLALPEDLKEGEADIAKGKLKLAIAKVHEYAAEQGGVRTIDLLEANKKGADGDKYSIKMKVIYENGIEQTKWVALKRISGKWKVDDFN